MKIVCIGNASYDITMPVTAYPVENTKNRIEQIIECGGGPASNAAYLLGKWNTDVYFLGMVGNDSHGNWIQKEFSAANVKTDHLEINPTYKTASSYIISNSSEGTRTVITHRKPLQMKKINLPFAPDYILMDGQEHAMSKKLLKEYPNAIAVIDADKDTKEIIELCTLCQYVVCSKEFAEKVTGKIFDFNRNETIRDIYFSLKEKFSGKVIVTLEEKGSLYEKDGMIKIMPSISVKPVDSTGAGDIFHGAFIYGLSKRYDLEKILKISNVAGAISTQKIGGRFSVPSKEDIRKIIRDFK
ncbi:MAG: PfkB family carbohydrate kinase [Bacilli bacterium]|nr:PfkB family carbohydrate kinase [Bacilli bacterium]